MATGGFDRTVDSRVTCSICLEPYRGRHPKLLPCFHTFCRSCLQQLADKASAELRSAQGLEESDEGVTSQVTITCPTRRHHVPLPPGGVAKLQSNFYLDDDSGREDLRPLLCNLCDGKQDAKFTCSKCHNNLCAECRRFHDKLCQSKTVTVLQSIPSTGHLNIVSVDEKAQKQAEVLNTALNRLAHKDRQMERERETLEQDIHVRYATLFRLAAEARDASLASLRDAAQAVKDRLQAEETLAKNALQRLRHGSAEVTGARSSSAQAQAWLLSDEELLRFQEQTFGSGDGPVLCWLDAEHGDTASVEKSLQSFVGTAVEATQASGQTAGSEAVGVNAAQDQRPKLQGEVDMTENESPNELPGNAGATRDWQKAFDGLVDRINELTSLKDKNLILCQDLEVVKAENSRLRRDVTDSIANLARVVDDVNALQGDHSDLKTEVASSKSAVATLQHAMKSTTPRLEYFIKTWPKLRTKSLFYREIILA